MMEQRTIQVEISGEGVHPNTTPIKVLTSFLNALEQAVTETATEKGIELGEDPILALTDISEGSNRLHIAFLLAVLPAVGQITQAISSNDITSLPYKAQHEVRKIAEIATERKHSIRFVSAPLYRACPKVQDRLLRMMGR